MKKKQIIIEKKKKQIIDIRGCKVLKEVFPQVDNL